MDKKDRREPKYLTRSRWFISLHAPRGETVRFNFYQLLNQGTVRELTDTLVIEGSRTLVLNQIEPYRSLLRAVVKEHGATENLVGRLFGYRSIRKTEPEGDNELVLHQVGLELYRILDPNQPAGNTARTVNSLGKLEAVGKTGDLPGYEALAREINQSIDALVG